jgi:hypothetical protein
VAQVELFYTRDGGATWKLIDFVDESLRDYDWLVPPVKNAKNECKVKVILRNRQGKSLGSDVSDVYFTIEP